MTVTVSAANLTLLMGGGAFLGLMGGLALGRRYYWDGFRNGYRRGFRCEKHACYVKSAETGETWHQP